MSVTAPAAVRHRRSAPPQRLPAAARAAVATTSAPRRSAALAVIRLAAFAPYLVFVGVAVAFATSSPRAIESLWLLAPATLALCMCLAALAIAEHAYRRRRVRVRAARIDRLRQALLRALRAPPGSSAAALRPAHRLGAIRAVSEASRGLSDQEQERLRATLDSFSVTDWVEGQAQRARRKWQRAEALNLLGWLAREGSIELLGKTLRSADLDLAYVAGQSLAEFDSSAAYGLLLDALDTGRLPRSRVATLLEGSRCRRATTLSLERSDTGDPQVRFWIAYLLGRTREPRVSETLRRLAADDDLNVRANATEALGEVGDTTAIGALLDDPEWLVRAHAAKAARAAQAEELAPQLAVLLADQYWWVRQNATLALQRLGPAAVEPVRLMLESEDRFARNKAAEILVHVGYVSDQIARLGGTGGSAWGSSGAPGAPNGSRGEAAAWRFLLALGRAEGVAALEAAAAALPDPALRRQLDQLLQRALDEKPTSLQRSGAPS